MLIVAAYLLIKKLFVFFNMKTRCWAWILSVKKMEDYYISNRITRRVKMKY